MRSTNRLAANAVPIALCIVFVFTSAIAADGGYVGPVSSSVPVSSNQRAIILKNGNDFSITFSTAYTGEGEEFAWIIPVPTPPSAKDLIEAGEHGKDLFKLLDDLTAPVVTDPHGGGGCFPAGTLIVTTNGVRAIETIEPGVLLPGFNPGEDKWVTGTVTTRYSRAFEGEMITITANNETIRSTGNHPFYVIQGEGLQTRAVPKDVPPEDQEAGRTGRWVEARDLKTGDLLLGESGSKFSVTSLSRRSEKTIVYNLAVDGHHTYLVGHSGILVHNKGGAEGPGPHQFVTVYDTISLEHYEAAVLGAQTGQALNEWLLSNGYEVGRDGTEILDYYVSRKWSFVAVKLHPDPEKHYQNEFLPPLTIRYTSDVFAFPLHISALSTTETVRITLYIIAESTVSSSNFRTRPLQYDEEMHVEFGPEKYIRECIRDTVHQGTGTALAVMWKDAVDKSIYGHQAIRFLHSKRFSRKIFWFLTRLETWIDPSEMKDDIIFVLDAKPETFKVNITAHKGYEPSIVLAAKSGDLEEIKQQLRDGASLYDAREQPLPLMEAVDGGHAEVVRMLIQAGVSVNQSSGFTALMNASLNGHYDIVQMLMESGADVNAKSSLGIIYSKQGKSKDIWTALRAAVQMGHRDIVKLLLDAGTEVDVRYAHKTTILMIAAQRGDAQIVRLLLEAGTDADAEDDIGQTAANYADNPEIIEIIRAAAVE